jgi:hypothetical protein
MIHVITLLVALVIDILVVTAVYNNYGIDSYFISTSIVSLVGFVIWIVVITCAIWDSVKKQVENFEVLAQIDELRDALIEELKADKTANEEALDKYKGEAKTALVDNYKNFEENLMDKVHDSKLVAMVLRKSGYADVLNEYHKHIVTLTNKIRECDIDINQAVKNAKKDKACHIKEILIRQGQGIFGYHYFFPKRLIYRHLVRDE